MPTYAAIRREFPGAISEQDFVARTRELLAPLGFDAENTIACVGVCRDELARPLIGDVGDAWGEAFNFSSLAGLLTLGRTGFAAARSHAPHVDGRERFVFISMPHVGIDGDGTLGRVQRRGQPEPTPACGALLALAAELHAGPLRTEIDPDDIEQSLLRRRLDGLVDASASVGAITHGARRAFLEDLEHLIATADMTNVDYAVFSGVQIHTPEGDLVWPADAYAVVREQRHDLPPLATKDR